MTSCLGPHSPSAASALHLCSRLTGERVSDGMTTFMKVSRQTKACVNLRRRFQRVFSPAAWKFPSRSSLQQKSKPYITVSLFGMLLSSLLVVCI